MIYLVEYFSHIILQTQLQLLLNIFHFLSASCISRYFLWATTEYDYRRIDRISGWWRIDITIFLETIFTDIFFITDEKYWLGHFRENIFMNTYSFRADISFTFSSAVSRRHFSHFFDYIFDNREFGRFLWSFFTNNISFHFLFDAAFFSFCFQLSPLFIYFLRWGL